MAMSMPPDLLNCREAWEDWADRVARNDPDWNFYMPGEPRPVLPWWRRLLKL